MRDTIELLEAIGRDASLRHATADELAAVLAQAGASASLTAAVAANDRTLLAGEFGEREMFSPQISQSPGCEDDDLPPCEGDEPPVPAGEPDDPDDGSH